MDTTGKALVEHWKWASDKGLMNENTANGYRAACNQVLGVLDEWETLDVAAIDIDDVMRRFINKRSKDFAPGSLVAYKRRFAQAVAEFLSYTKSPETWKPSMPERPSSRKENRVDVALRGVGAVGSVGTMGATIEASITPNRTGLVEYPFPLREGRFAYLRLPADLNAADVKRLVAYLNTLVLEA
jgi:hypothetical protein